MDLLKRVGRVLFKHKLWRISLAALLIADVAYFLPAPFGWPLTLGFFLIIPGYLIFKAIRHNIHLRWEIVAFSLGLSIIFLMVSGLVLNSMYYAGLERPLGVLNIFITVNIGVLALIWLNRKTIFHVPKVPGAPRHFVFAFALLFLPLLAAGGAIQLNNGVQSVLPLVVFGVIALSFLILMWRKNAAHIYPYALFIMALSILLTVSLRGEGVTGHDIQREFYVFQLAQQAEFWDIKAFTDPYNACLSITILPVMIAKLTGMADPLVFKIVFQFIFAAVVIPIYYFMRRLRNSRIALMGTFLFISFPTFLGDMPMLNRQEISILFFALTMLIVLSSMPIRQKKFLTFLFLLGAVLSHYSSSYIILSLLIGSWLVYLLIVKVYKNSSKEKLTIAYPTLNIVIIVATLLGIFLWNVQITGTTKGLESTVTKTIGGFFDKSSASSSGDVGYSLFAGQRKSPQELLDAHVKKTTPEGSVPVEHVRTENLPLTPIGESINKYVDVAGVNNAIRGATARILQVALFIGCIVLFVVYRKRKLSQEDTYFLALIITSIGFLGLQTVLPQLSVDYGTLRLFQQLLVILAIPIVIGFMSCMVLFRRYAIRLTSIIFACLFLHLSGFIPQITGGYPPQLSLNNAGFYYDAYYTHRGEKLATKWHIANSNPRTATAADVYALSKFDAKEVSKMIITSPVVNFKEAYIYKDYVNTKTDTYMIIVNSDLFYYRPERNIRESILYANGDSTIVKAERK